MTATFRLLVGSKPVIFNNFLLKTFMVFSMPFASCNVTSTFQEIPPGSVALFQAQLSGVTSSLDPAEEEGQPIYYYRQFL